MERMHVPVIGIGAGPATDGQVLVFHDILGIYEGHAPRFMKRYANVKRAMVQGVGAFADDVRQRRYPAEEHCYGIDAGELERFREIVDPGKAWDIADALR
jgi:3-methyl-2-oxobutanoate hydroxymethyltransferase